MSLAAWLALVLIWTGGGLLNAWAQEEPLDSLAVQATSATQNTQVIGIDDAELEAGPLNVDFSFTGIFNPNTWRLVGEALTFDYVFFTGNLQVVRYVLLCIPSALFLMLAKDMAPAMLGAIRGAITRIP